MGEPAATVTIIERPDTDGTKRRLVRWGMQAARRVDRGLGYPQAAPFLAQRVDNDRAYDGLQMSTDFDEVNAAVNECPRHIVQALFYEYAMTGTQIGKARALNLSRQEFHARLRHGVDQVHCVLRRMAMGRRPPKRGY